MSSDNMNSGSRKYEIALSEMYTKSPDIPHVLKLLREASSEGSRDASYALASWYLNGKAPWIEKDPRKAIPLLEDAAKANNPDAAYDLAWCLETGEGIARDVRRAFELYLTAALWGHEQAVYETSRCFFYGIGAACDKDVARIWMDRARALGFDISGKRVDSAANNAAGSETEPPDTFRTTPAANGH
jgi:TPR repeat protein